MQYKIIESKVKICTQYELSEEHQNLIQKAKESALKAYAPYSKFYVGAAVLLQNGEIITGNNQENSAYPSGMCAERVAVNYANSQYPDEPIIELAVAAFTQGDFTAKPITPCGGCRQVLLESEIRFSKDITVLLYGTEEVCIINGIKDLLPLSFGKDSLKG